MSDHVHTKFRTAAGSIRCSTCKKYFIDYNLKYHVENLLDNEIVQKSLGIILLIFFLLLIAPWLFRFFAWWYHMALG